MKFNWRSLSGALIIFMLAIEAWIQIRGLMIGNVQTERYHMFELWGLYVGSPFYTYLTYAFIHGSLIHVLMNMFVTFQFAPPIERVMGSAKFAAFTIISAIICGLGAYWIMTALRGINNFVLIGFSGVIFAYIGVFFRVNLDEADDKWGYTKKFFTFNFLLIGFILIPIFMPSLGISGEAHLIGAIFGFFFGNLFLSKKRRPIGRL